MIGGFSTTALLFVTATATLAGAAHAANPARITHLVDKAILNERDRGEIRAYAQFWGEAIDSEKAAEIEKAELAVEKAEVDVEKSKEQSKATAKKAKESK